MKKFVLLSVMVALTILAFTFSLTFTEHAAFADTSADWSVSGNSSSLTMNEDGSYQFAPGSVFTYNKNVDMENEGIAMTFGIEGVFNRQDSWFALLIQSESGQEIGEYRGFNYQFKPVSNQAVSGGSLSAYQSVYALGLKEGGNIPRYVNTITTTEIETRETPTRFEFSVYQVDGTFIVNFGLDTFTFPMSLPEIDLSSMRVSFIFGGADVLNSEMRVKMIEFGPAMNNGYFNHATVAEPDDAGGVRISERTKQQGKIMYPVALNSEKEIVVNFKINEAPGYFIGDNIDAWFGIFLTAAPNSALPGSATVGVILRAHEDVGGGRKIIGGQFFKSGVYAGGFAAGVTTKPGNEFDSLTFLFKEGKVEFLLEGTTVSVGEIDRTGISFPDEVAYISFAFFDDQPASIIHYNEYHEEIGREANPDVKYWEVTLGEIIEIGTPVVESNKKYNIYGGIDPVISVRLYSSTFVRLQVEEGDEYVDVPADKYSLKFSDDILQIIFTNEYAKSILDTPKSFRLWTESEKEEYNNVCTDFSATIVEANAAEVKVNRGVYDDKLYNDVKLSFELHDDAFVEIVGSGIQKSDYFYNPVTGNLYIKREYLKTLSEGDYDFTVIFEYSSHDVEITRLGEEETEKTGCGANLAQKSIMAALFLSLCGIALIKMRRKKV